MQRTERTDKVIHSRHWSAPEFTINLNAQPTYWKDDFLMKPIVALLLCFFIATPLQAAEPSAPTRALNGTDITYEYDSGRSYNVKFEEAGISYRYLTGSRPDAWWGPFPYKAFKVGDDLFMASWFEAGYGDYVTLLINFDTKILYGSAILSGEEVHFHGAKIVKIQR